ncbi:MAG: hypothetical protein AAFN12_08335 [Cyanobacteria bacterium J06560_2]
MKQWVIVSFTALTVGLTAGLSLGFGLELGLDRQAIAVEPPAGETPSDEAPRPHMPLRTRISCPSEPAALVGLMIRDIPDYTNRVIQRTVAVLPWTEADERRVAAGEFVRRPYRPSHVIVAGQPDLTPLDLNEYAYTTDPDAGGELTQVFFTTLSRQYSDLRAEEVQQYHWLFLTQTTDGWRLAFMFSAIDTPQTNPSPMPPRESSQSSVGQAVRIWLKDCRADAIQAIAVP